MEGHTQQAKIEINNSNFIFLKTYEGFQVNVSSSERTNQKNHRKLHRICSHSRICILCFVCGTAYFNPMLAQMLNSGCNLLPAVNKKAVSTCTIVLDSPFEMLVQVSTQFYFLSAYV